MKKYLLVGLIVLITFKVSAQSLFIAQDVKLAIMRDDYGNIPFTADFLVRYKLKDYHFSVSLELANLRTNYYRFSIGTPFNYEYKHFNIGITPEFGIIYHKKFYYILSPSLEIHFGYEIFKNLIVGSMLQKTYRSEYGIIRNSVFGYIEFRFNNKNNKNAQKDYYKNF